jgi:outer membrane protein OmpA-like peptidoglycan-associated protein
LTELFHGPTLSEIYCAGFISKEKLKPSGTMVAGNYSPDQAQYTENGYIFLTGSDLQEGKEYLLLRHAYDPNQYQSFPGQLGILKNLGELYQDLGRAKVLYIRNRTAVAHIESSCSDVMPGDIAVPFQERPRPEFKQTTFERFAPPNGKTTGRIVMGRDLDTEFGSHRIVYLNVGESQGVKPGDYFRITREYSSSVHNPAEAIGFEAPAYDDTQKDPSKFNFRRQAGELPRRSIGELMVINAGPNSSTALTTYTPEDARLGDGVEMIESTPYPPPAPEPVAAPEPPTISCSVSRSTIQVGETANITCNGVPEEGHTVTYSYQASAGQITPHDSRATLTGTTPGPVTVTATAVDDRNLSAQTTLNVDVQAAPTPVTPTSAPTPALLNELIFKPNSARVDNKAKALLDDDALRLQRDANATMIIEGSSNPSENEALATQRAENAKTYLVQSKGIDPNRIQTRPAASKTGAKVNVIMVPAGAGPQ